MFRPHSHKLLVSSQTLSPSQFFNRGTLIERMAQDYAIIESELVESKKMLEESYAELDKLKQDVHDKKMAHESLLMLRKIEEQAHYVRQQLVWAIVKEKEAVSFCNAYCTSS